MSLAEELDLHGASARQAVVFASPKTALASLIPQAGTAPAVQQIKRLSPGAQVPEQEPAPQAPAAKSFDRGSFGSTIPVSLGQRRLAGVVIQASAIVPRLVGNREYEITYEIPAAEDQEPEVEVDDGDPLPAAPIRIWCNDCNCYYCYVGPLDIDVPFDSKDKGTWPFMAMMGTYQSRICIAWDYKRHRQFGNEIEYGALVDKGLSGQTDRWTYYPPPGTGLPNDPIVPVTCGPCAGSAPFPDGVESDLEVANQTISPAPHTHFAYFGYILTKYGGAADPDAIGVYSGTNYAFYYAVQSELSITLARIYNINEEGEGFDYTVMDVKLYRIFYNATMADEEFGEQLPGTSEGAGVTNLLPGWRLYEEVESFTGEGSVWADTQCPPDLGYLGTETGWTPSGPPWREWVKDHGGWAPDDEPSKPPEYKMVEYRREDPEDPFSEFKLLPTWNVGMVLAEDETTPLHRPAGGQCTDVTDYSDI